MSGVARDSLRRVGRLVPGPLRADLKDAWNLIQATRASRRWQAAVPEARLEATLLPVLAARYPVAPVNYGYSPDETLERGVERSRLLEPYAPAHGDVLEIGSADGMTACMMARSGRGATAIDLDTSRTDPRVEGAGVRVLSMDATRLDFPGASFDLVYSFNVFEHLGDPAATFSEMIRVLRPGGVAYVAFTGLRWSPHGGHLYKSTGIPYVTVLFEEADVGAFLRASGQTDWAPWVNDYSIERFREVFRGHTNEVETLHFRETLNRWHASLISEFAGVFKRYAPSFESLLVDTVRLIVRKASGGKKG
jgi:SAM-dependent methyltransferase